MIEASRYVEVNRDMDEGFIISFNIRDMAKNQIVKHLIYTNVINLHHNVLMEAWIMNGSEPLSNNIKRR